MWGIAPLISLIRLSRLWLDGLCIDSHFHATLALDPVYLARIKRAHWHLFIISRSRSYIELIVGARGEQKARVGVMVIMNEMGERVLGGRHDSASFSRATASTQGE